jgi:hypothetical protein
MSLRRVDVQYPHPSFLGSPSEQCARSGGFDRVDIKLRS